MKQFIVRMLMIFTLVSCSTPAQQPKSALQESTRDLTVNGSKRAYILHVPQNLDLQSPSPVILAFHGGFQSARRFAEVTKLSERALPAGFIVVYPEGYKRSWNAGDCCGPSMRQDIDDMAFVDALLADLNTVATIDQRRIFATGFSNGAKMVYRLACGFSERIAAIAPVGAAISINESDCNPKRPIPVLHFHGLADKFAPYEGGPSSRTQAGEQRSVLATINLWARRNGCLEEPRIDTIGGTTYFSYPNCRQGSRVILVTVNDLAHQWPGGEVVFPSWLGAGTDEISATNQIVTFFQNSPTSTVP